MIDTKKYFKDDGDLNNRVIINDLRKAENEYKCGFILLCKEKLDNISAAIKQYHENLRGGENETLA